MSNAAGGPQLPDANAHYFVAEVAALDDVHRSALRPLRSTGRAQAVHLHAAGEPCARGECYLLRIGEPR